MPFAADVAALVTPPNAVVAAVPTATWSTITVRPGDTLWHLAIAHRTTISAIVSKNRLSRGGAVIHVGQKLLIPTGSTGTTTTTPTTQPSTKPTATPTAPTRPTTGSAAAPGTTARTHVVRAGETMSVIAQRYHVSLTKLLAANRLRVTSYIYVGQRIAIPGATATKPSRPSTSGKPTTPATTPKPATQPAPKPDTSTVAGSKARLAAMNVPSRMATEALIRATATRHGVDPKLALAIGWIESGWNQKAVSYTNAVGVMQIMPSTGIWASQLAGRKLDLYDVNDNVTAGVLVLRSLHAMADSSDQAVAAYYQGLYSVRTRGLYTDTKAYVATVKATYARL